MNKQVFFLSTTGFIIGAAVGFMWSTGVKSRVSESVTTSVNGGEVLIKIDMENALIGGALDIFKK